jgi:protein gp37
LKAIAEGDLRKKAIQPYRNVISDIDLRQGWNGEVVCREKELEQPIHWRKGRMIFVCSMGDLFHEKVPFEFIQRVFDIIKECPQHTFQTLTKRPLIMAKYITAWEDYPYPENLWLGTSISTQADADKNIPILLQIPAAVRFVSLEPMLERVDLRKLHYGYIEQKPVVYNSLESYSGHEGLDWLIIGCESGPNARLCSIEDIRDDVRQGQQADVPVFVKQIPLNGKCSKKPEEWPDDLKGIRQYPNP